MSTTQKEDLHEAEARQILPGLTVADLRQIIREEIAAAFAQRPTGQTLADPRLPYTGGNAQVYGRIYYPS